MATKQAKKMIAREVLVIPKAGGPDGDDVLWCVRIIVPHLPFYLDSKILYQSKADADEVADKWRKRRISMSVGYSAVDHKGRTNNGDEA